MKNATITQAKNQLSRLLDVVRHGESVLILDRNRPVARLDPVVGAETSSTPGRILRLERAGLLAPARRDALPNGWLREALPAPRSPGGAVEALIREREESR